MRLEGYTFSFINCPISTSDFFFIKMRTDLRYYLMDREKYEKEYFRLMRVAYNQLEDFTRDLNKIVSPVRKDSRKIYRKKHIKTVVTVLIIILVAIMILTAMFFFRDLILKEHTTTGLIGTGIVFLLIASYLMYRSLSDKSHEYGVYKSFIHNQDKVDRFLKKWNREQFHKVSLTAVAPLCYQYIQFNINQNVTLYLEDHALSDE